MVLIVMPRGSIQIRSMRVKGSTIPVRDYAWIQIRTSRN